MTYAEWQNVACALVHEQGKAVNASNDVRRPADEAVRAHDVAAERHYIVNGGKSVVHVSGGGRWVSCHKVGSSSFDIVCCSSTELLALALARLAVEDWQAGRIAELPQSTCDEHGKPVNTCNKWFRCQSDGGDLKPYTIVGWDAIRGNVKEVVMGDRMLVCGKLVGHDGPCAHE